MIATNDKDNAVHIAYIDGAFPNKNWPPYYMKNFNLYPQHRASYLQGFWVGKRDRFYRWIRGYEPNFW